MRTDDIKKRLDDIEKHLNIQQHYLSLIVKMLDKLHTEVQYTDDIPFINPDSHFKN